jgi:hypothetical protein
MPSYKDNPFRNCQRLRYYQFPSSVPLIRKLIRGLPSHMFSDNSTNFHDADRELQTNFQAVNSDLILQVTLVNDGVHRHFISSTAPHFGGFWKLALKVLNFISDKC